MTIAIKRVYEPAEKADGHRVLIDRLWPRGLKKEDVAIDEWLKELAPSAELRRWFGHEPARWTEFLRRYATELDQAPASWQPLADRSRHHAVTLVYAAKDTDHCNALALKEYLQRWLHTRD